MNKKLALIPLLAFAGFCCSGLELKARTSTIKVKCVACGGKIERGKCVKCTKNKKPPRR